MEYTRISADCHIDMPWLPHDLFTANASAVMKDRMPYVETLMWGSDYPHPDGVWPQSSRYIEEQFGHLPPDVVHKITCENAGKF